MKKQNRKILKTSLKQQKEDLSVIEHDYQPLIKEKVDKIIEQGKYTLEFNCPDKEDLFSELSLNDRLNDDVFEFIEDKVEIIPDAIPLEICFVSRKKVEEEKIKEAYVGHYYNEYVKSKRNAMKNYRKGLLLGLIGIILLTVYGIIELRSVNISFNEFFCIIAWVFLWESVDHICLESADIRAEERKYRQLATAKVTFKNN